MVTKKPKSKRLSAAHKYKVQKKVREHHRKIRKESKNKSRSGSNKKLPLQNSLIERLETEKMAELAKKSLVVAAENEIRLAKAKARAEKKTKR